MRWFSGLAATSLTFLAAAASADAPVADLGSQDAPAFSAQQLFAPPTGDWLANGGSLSKAMAVYFAVCSDDWMYAVTSLSSSGE